ncbi:ABC-type proline/glycine betaine transport systems, periplasmic components [Serratia rubidaea]|uniref:ABC-type proline/glycine betaine transport systems, periplasmic components n=1 Tax=Serratia rubidaea TaxID=61652 RepID=A0A4U9HEA7_SERRU|nr:ABC-type proline/glycine betaine transport systems, periplasmic components [Serratia rubidaea]
MMGQLDLVKLEEPGADKQIHIKVGLSQVFNQQAPELVTVLSKVNLPLDLLNQNLALMKQKRNQLRKTGAGVLQTASGNLAKVGKRRRREENSGVLVTQSNR